MSLKHSFLNVTVPITGYTFIRGIGATLRREETQCEPLFEAIEKNQPFLLACWHNRLFYLIYYFSITIVRQGQQISPLISASRDGEYIARVAKFFGTEPQRGSTSKQSLKGLAAMVRAAKKGNHLMMTPDGPRGPKYAVQEGTLFLAQKTGLPILPITYGVKRAKRFNSWDRFMVPYPFGQVRIICGNLIHVDPDLSEQALSEKNLELETVLKEITEQADNW